MVFAWPLLQNLNLMLGFPETTGLERVPIYP